MPSSWYRDPTLVAGGLPQQLWRGFSSSATELKLMLSAREKRLEEADPGEGYGETFDIKGDRRCAPRPEMDRPDILRSNPKSVEHSRPGGVAGLDGLRVGVSVEATLDLALPRGLQNDAYNSFCRCTTSAALATVEKDANREVSCTSCVV